MDRAGYIVVGFLVAGAYAFGRLRGRWGRSPELAARSAWNSSTGHLELELSGARGTNWPRTSGRWRRVRLARGATACRTRFPSSTKPIAQAGIGRRGNSRDNKCSAICVRLVTRRGNIPANGQMGRFGPVLNQVEGLVTRIGRGVWLPTGTPARDRVQKGAVSCCGEAHRFVDSNRAGFDQYLDRESTSCLSLYVKANEAGAAPTGDTSASCGWRIHSACVVRAAPRGAERHCAFWPHRLFQRFLISAPFRLPVPVRTAPPRAPKRALSEMPPPATRTRTNEHEFRPSHRPSRGAPKPCGTATIFAG
jgi:hypothetical protein